MTQKTLRQINALADAIVRRSQWRQRMMELRQEERIKRMLKRQLSLRINRKRSLSD